MGLIFPLLYWHHGLRPELGFSLVYACLLTLIFVIDVEHQLILDRVVYPGMGLALALSPFNPALGIDTGLRVISSVSGGAAGLAIMLLIFLIARGGMGLGDVKMAALVGLVAGFPKVFIALFLSIMAGGLVAIALLTLRHKIQPSSRQPVLILEEPTQCLLVNIGGINFHLSPVASSTDLLKRPKLSPVRLCRLTSS